MSALSLLIIALIAIAVLLLLVIVLDVPAYVSLLLVAMGTALVAGIPIADVVPTMIEGMGKTLGSVAIVVGLGAMLGRLVEVSGAADHMARAFTEKLGAARVVMAVTAASFILGIPVFFDVGFIILAPLIFAFARNAKLSPLAIAFPVCVAMTTLHTIIPPHPGPVAAAAALEADAGLVTMWALLIALIVTVIGYFVIKPINFKKIALAPSPAESAQGSTSVQYGPAEGGRVPGAGTTVFVIVLPILMIMAGSIMVMNLPETSAIRPIADFVGKPATSLLVGVLVAYVLIMRITKWKKGQIAKVADSALDAVAIVIFVTGAGGVFANVLVKTGIGTAFSDLLTSIGMPTILAGFVIAAALRVAQGSSSVSILTAAGLIYPAVVAGGYSPTQVALITIAMGFGGLFCSHINDSGFWIVTKYLGLSVSQGLRTWTVLTTAVSVVGFLVTAALFMVVG
ncbi:gluconate:H+ symporter [Actinomyces sp. B33]|uniref:GntT/GntP/DsdX family permease n=1 Tax=Actinomyces sp. B33 TaxID=2942131 RepID=UPI002340E5D4|nr:gluconate:H+ symporter [Actinomyces sp. B33]MDC4232472.1 gluconate:H+ symporter [Actinomyces sp. B33]